MTVGEALKKCPELLIVEPNMDKYVYYSRLFFEYLSTITPLLEPGSIDEAYLDVTDIEVEDYINLAKKIQDDLYTMYQLPASIGIGPNKFLAKTASDMKKPLGITVLRKKEIIQKLWPLSIEKMYGVGKKTLPLLQMIGIKTIGDLANYQDMKMLYDTIGINNAKSLYEHAHGKGDNIINYNRFNEVSSISNSQTFENDEYNVSNMKMVLKILVNTVSNRLEKRSLKAYTFTIQIKYNNFKMNSRTRSLDNPINDNKSIYQVVDDLFEELYDSDYPVRLLGVASSKLIESKEEIRQMSIYDAFDDAEKDYSVQKLITSLQKTYGSSSITKGIKK